MKIGIITFHSAHNYGATLQAFALQEYIKSLKHETYIIDYRPDYITKCYLRNNNRDWLSKNPILCLKRLLRYIRYRKIRHSRYDNFQQFINRRFNLYPFTEKMDFHEFDALLIGSDQVWSPYHTGGHYDDIMFGEGFRCKVISYAPSCSQEILEPSHEEYLKSHLTNFSAISVREYRFKEMLQPLTSKLIQVVVDPTILAGRDVFERIAEPINKKKPYVLVYEITPHSEVRKTAKGIACQLDADVIELTNGMLNYHSDEMDEGASPEKFLGYIKEAACVVTTSFHGTAFSLIFQTPFYMVKQGNVADNRMVSLLQAVNMEERIIQMGVTPSFSVPNFSEMQKKIERMNAVSQSFIINSLKK